MEDDDDQQSGPAVTTGSSERDSNHDRVEDDTSFQNQDLPFLVGSRVDEPVVVVTRGSGYPG
jgi:hypothetical protein